MAASLAACGGYSVDSGRVDLDEDTSMETTLDVMNALGREYYVETRRSFEISGDCQLRVRTGGHIVGSSDSLPLRAVQVRRDASDNGRFFSVVVSSPEDAPGLEFRVLDNAPFFDAHRMGWLIQHARALCGRDKALRG